MIRFSIIFISAMMGATAHTETADQFFERITGPTLNQSRFAYNAKCRRFIRDDGRLGEYGTLVVHYLQNVEGAKTCMIDGGIRMDVPDRGSIVSNSCPNYERFSRNERMHFWVWVFTAIAAVESSCDVNADTQGVNGIADGLFQLEHNRHWRSEANRDPLHCAPGMAVDTKNVHFQVACSISILRDTACGRNLAKIGDKSLVNRNQYWQELKSSNREISQRIAAYPKCSAPTSYFATNN